MFKIGDRVKLEHWKSFLPIVGIAENSIEIQEDDTKGLYSLDQNFIKEETIMQKVMKPVDEFREGDEVWCVMYGKGIVDNVCNAQDMLCVAVSFNSGDYNWYTKDGKYNTELNRTLFFSEPRVEASLTRPFVPTLVGKTVVVKLKSRSNSSVLYQWQVYFEDANSIQFKESGTYHKQDIEAIYEVSSENLLKP